MKGPFAIGAVLAAVAIAGCGAEVAGRAAAELADSGAANAIERAASAARSRTLAGVADSSAAGERLSLTEATGSVAREAEPAAADVAGVSAKVAASPEAESTLRNCTSGAVQDTAQAYVDAYASGDDSPDLSGVLTTSLSGCLSEAYPDQSQVSHRARDPRDDGAALAGRDPSRDLEARDRTTNRPEPSLDRSPPARARRQLIAVRRR